MKTTTFYFAEFKNALDISLNKVKQKRNSNSFNLYWWIYKERELAGKPNGSIQVYKTLKHLKDYSKKYGKLNYEDIDIEFLDKFQNFLYSAPRSLFCKLFIEINSKFETIF